MLEVLVSVAVLGLVVTASLKLAALSQKGLANVRAKEELLNESAKMQVQLAIDPTNTFGISGDIEWNVTEHEEDVLIDDIDIGFEDEDMLAQKERLQEQKLRWRELEVQYKQKSIVVFLPYSKTAAALSSLDAVMELMDR